MSVMTVSIAAYMCGLSFCLTQFGWKLSELDVFLPETRLVQWSSNIPVYVNKVTNLQKYLIKHRF